MLAKQPDRAGKREESFALESAWDQAEQTRTLPHWRICSPENLVDVDDDGSPSTKRQFLADVKSADTTGETINNEGGTAHLCGNVAMSTGI